MQEVGETFDKCSTRAKVFWEKVRKPFGVLSLIYCVGILAIVRANFLYIDDLGRNIAGYRGWENFSRFTSNNLSQLINGSKTLNDISPATQFIAAEIMAFAAIIILYVMNRKEKVSISMTISAVPIALNPYFLECFSYKFDSPYMALSVLASVLPFLFAEWNKYIFIAISILSLLIMFTTYQAASGIYVMLALFLWLEIYTQDYKTKKWRIAFVTETAVSYISAGLIYRFFIMVPVDSYVSSKPYSISRIFPGMLINYRNYFSLVSTDNKRLWRVLIMGIMILFIITTIIRSKKNAIITLLLSLMILLMSSVCSIGLYVVLEKPLTTPRAMYPLGVLIALMSIEICKENIKVPLHKIIPLYFSFCLFIFAFTYGNALAEQKRYTEFRIQCVVSDLQTVSPMLNSNVKAIQLDGDIGMSPVVARLEGDYGILARLIPSTFAGNGWMWAKYYFMSYYGLKNITEDPNIDLRTMNLPVLSDSMYQTIYGDDTHILIGLK